MIHRIAYDDVALAVHELQELRRSGRSEALRGRFFTGREDFDRGNRSDRDDQISRFIDQQPRRKKVTAGSKCKF